MTQPWSSEVERFCRQYLQLESVLDFPQPSSLRLPEAQGAIFDNLFADGAVRYEPPARFKSKALKELVKKIEESIGDGDQYEVSGDLVDALSGLLGKQLTPDTVSAQRKFYVTYYLSGLPDRSPRKQLPSITLLENRGLISAAGTTGHRTWEAALHLGQYLCQNPAIIQGKTILDLGTGTGYLAILCARHLAASHVIASDGSDDVLDHLTESFFLNDLQDSPRVRPMDIKWGYALVGTEDEEWNGGQRVDVVLGADVTYDDSVVPALASTLTELFTLNPEVDMYIAAAQRNEKTFHVFLEVCQRNKLMVEILDFPVPPRTSQSGPFYADDVTISVCKIWKSK